MTSPEYWGLYNRSVCTSVLWMTEQYIAREAIVLQRIGPFKIFGDNLLSGCTLRNFLRPMFLLTSVRNLLCFLLL